MIKNIVAVMSGKGGVGKSFVSSLLAVNLNREGKKVGIMDADITGPSIPKIFGLDDQRVELVEGKIMPVETKTGIKVMSLNLLLEDKKMPVIWRGPLISNAVKQFYNDTIWGDLDYLVIDLPPGTADVTLTVMQSIPLTSMVIVTSPQDLVNLIVEKSIHMGTKMNIPIVGMVENMSYLVCPDCGKKINLYGESKGQKVADTFNIDLLAQLPINPEFTQLCDKGLMEDFDKKYEEFGTIGKMVIEKIEGEK